MASTQVANSQIVEETTIVSLAPSPFLSSPTAVPNSPTSMLDFSISILDSPNSNTEPLIVTESGASTEVATSWKTQSTEVSEQPIVSSTTGQREIGAAVPAGVAIGAALGALVAGVLIVVLALCIWKRRRKNRAKLSRLEAASSCHRESRRGPITPFDRFEGAATVELAVIQKGLAEDQRRHPTASLVATDFPSEKGRLAAASTYGLPVLDSRPWPSKRSNASSTAPQTSWSATPSNSVASSAVRLTPTLPPPSTTTSPSQYSTSSAFHYSHSAASQVLRRVGNGPSPASLPLGDRSSAVEITQESPFNNPPSIGSNDARRAGSSGQRTVQHVLDLDPRQYDLEVLQRAIQPVNAGNGAGRMHGSLLVEPPPAYQAGPLPN
ncbi:hypothetical protein BKA70DRAFT_1422922 [Coprinopsis sp. MPI-PUGE-AT-0042]|nr:hypothetical protein BKA70DRAFT_1422922 [Coprinopsis sp. MPI-PUGE-AT-0042]